MVTVSVIIPTVHSCDQLLEPLVDAISQYGRTGILDQVVVQDGGTFAESCNAGAKKATGDILIFVNDDCELQQTTWLDELIAPFDDPKVGVVGCRLLYPSGSIQHSGVYFTVEEGWNAHHFHHEREAGPIHAVTGACLAIRRDLFTELGGFNDEYRNGSEDIELCLKAWEAGHTVWYTPAATLIHHESQSSGRWEHTPHNVALFRSRWVFRVGVEYVGDGSTSSGS